jgi:hypothetical protein
MKNSFLTVFLVAHLVSPLSARAEEVDDFLRTNSVKPREAMGEVNRIVNTQLERFATNYSKEHKSDRSCDRKAIVQGLLYNLDKNFTNIGHKLRDMSAEENSSIQFYGSDVSDSTVYRTASVPCCIKSLTVKGEVVGIDKIDHFFGNGGLLWEQFESGTTDKASLLQLNVNQEQGSWGLASTGVKSYGDLSANWDGLNFYRQLLDGPQRYLTCENGQITIRRQFKIEEHVTKAWRESVNCSSYSNKDLAGRVARQLKKDGLTCPADTSSCKEITSHYASDPDLQKAIVSPTCLKGIKVEDSIEVASTIHWTEAGKILGGVRVKDAFKFVKDQIKGPAEEDEMEGTK